MLDIFIEDGKAKGFLDFDKVNNIMGKFNYNYAFLVGARGVGKTFNALEWCYRHKLTFMYVRRLDTQVKICKTKSGQPFREINTAKGYNVSTQNISDTLTGLYEFEYEEEKKKYLPKGDPVGYITSLSTFANLNSASFPDVEVLVFDEFIAKPAEHPIKDEAGAFFGLCETIGRNRELLGKPPLKVFCLANSNRLATPLFIELEIVNKLVKSREKGYDYFCDNERGFIVIDITNSPISVQKQETSLYRLTKGTSYASMALDNDFTDYDDTDVINRNLQEYLPLVQVGEEYIYQHKSNGNYYVSSRKNGTFNARFSTQEKDLKTFTVHYGWNLRSTYLLNNNIEFNTYMDKVLFHKYIRI